MSFLAKLAWYPHRYLVDMPLTRLFGPIPFAFAPRCYWWVEFTATLQNYGAGGWDA